MTKSLTSSGGGGGNTIGSNVMNSMRLSPSMKDQRNGGGGDANIYGSRRGRGILKQLTEVPRIPFCEACRHEIR